VSTTDTTTITFLTVDSSLDFDGILAEVLAEEAAGRSPVYPAPPVYDPLDPEWVPLDEEMGYLESRYPFAF
jgi:hypothetical protein